MADLRPPGGPLVPREVWAPVGPDVRDTGVVPEMETQLLFVHKYILPCY